MSNIDLIYNAWANLVLREYSAFVPDINNENHIFELGKILNELGLDSFEIEETIENIKNQSKIVRINEERERKVPPGHILVKNKKSGYLYIVQKSTYSDNPERYSLPTNAEKQEWETGDDEPPPEQPEDTVIKTPRVSKAKIKGDAQSADIELKGDVESEEPLNAVEEPIDNSSSIFKFKINKAHFSKDITPSDTDFKSKRKTAKLDLPSGLDPYIIPDAVKKTALVPAVYPILVERIINTYNIEEAAELSFYINDLDIKGNLSEQLGQILTIINLTLSEELAEYFTGDLKNYISYVKEYDNSNETTYAKDSSLSEDWIKIAAKYRKKMLNFLSNKFNDEFIVVAATSSDPKDVKALNVGSKKDEKIGDANVKINANDKNYWLRIKIEAPENKQEPESDVESTDSDITEPQ